MTALTAREVLIAYLVMTGMGNEAIAAFIGCALNTVRNHLTNIHRKTGCRNRTELAVAAWEAMT